MTVGFREYLKQHWLGYAVVSSGILLFVLFFVGEYLQYRGELFNHIIELSPLHILIFLTLPLFITVGYLVDRAVLLQREARKSEEKYRELFENAYDLIVTFELKGNIASANKAALTLSGYTAEEINSLNIARILPPDVLQTAMTRIARIAAGETLPPYEYELIKKDGSRAIVELSSRAILSGGKAVSIHCIARDITERKHAEGALQESEERFRAITESAIDGIISADSRGIIIGWNKGAQTIFGYAEEEALGKPLPILIPEIDKEAFRRAIERLNSTEGESISAERIIGKTVELRGKRKDGSVFPLELSIGRWKTKKGTFYTGIVRDITGRKQTEEALRAASSYARSLIEASLDPLVTINHDGKITDVNKATELVTGVSREQLIGSDFSSYFTEPEKAREGYQQVISQGVVRDYPLTISHASGRLTDVLYNATVFRNEDGKVLGVFAAARDITLRKQMEQKIAESERYLNNIIESSPEAIIALDTGGNIVLFNDGAEKLFGYRRGEVIGKNIVEDGRALFYGEVEKARSAMRAMRESKDGRIANLEVPGKTRDGRDIYTSLSASLLKNEKGEVIGTLGIAKDVTQQMLAEEALRSSEEQYRSLVESTEDSIYVVDRDCRYLFINNKHLSRIGFSMDHVRNRSYSEFHSPEETKEFAEKVNNVFETAGSISYEHRSRRDGRYFLRTLSPMIIEGKVNAVTVISKDITERKQMEEALRESEASYRELADSITDIFFAVDKDLNYTYWNQASEMLSGVLAKDAIGKSVFDIFPEIRGTKIEKIYREVLKTQQPRIFESEFKRGVKKFFFEITAYPSENGLAVFAKDITERKQLEQELQGAYAELKEQYNRKMDFTNMAAHELKTPLVPIVGYLSMLKEAIQDEKLLHYLEIMERNAQRQSRLIDRMLELSRLDAGKVELNCSDVSVNELLRWMLYDYFPTGRDFLSDVPRNLMMRADEDKLFQILDNLISNAVKYSPAGTAIKICVEERSQDYLFKVSDHGPGIADEDQKRIFERFYIVGGQKTVRGSKRTGLGLALAKSYVELHGGSIWVESETGKGSTFCFTIPKFSASG